MIALQNIKKEFGGQEIYEDISIQVNSGFKLISSSDGKRNSSLMVWISRFLWVLFWGLGTMPLFMRMLSPFGIYDALLERKTKDIILNARNGQL